MIHAKFGAWLNGHGLARRVRGELGQGGVYLVALAGYGMPEDKRPVAEAGIDAHPVKPAKRDELDRLLHLHMAQLIEKKGAMGAES
ncbi:MAG: hypothetical protein AB7O62_19195 [Pirellulales bacterium]